MSEIHTCFHFNTLNFVWYITLKLQVISTRNSFSVSKPIRGLSAVSNGSCLVGFYVATTKKRLYGDVSALLLKEDMRCPTVYYFRHRRAPE
jgi:hypothetical protein